MSWIDTPDGVLAFHRGSGFACVVNYTTTPSSCRPIWPAEPVVASAALDADGRLPANAAAWLELG